MIPGCVVVLGAIASEPRFSTGRAVAPLTALLLLHATSSVAEGKTYVKRPADTLRTEALLNDRIDHES